MATINKTDRLDENEIISLFRKNIDGGERIGERFDHEHLLKIENTIKRSIKSINEGRTVKEEL